MEDLKDLLTAQELADAVNLSKQTVLNYEKAGAIKAGVKLANGQCFFGEDAVPTLLGLSVSKRYKDNTLAGCCITRRRFPPGLGRMTGRYTRTSCGGAGFLGECKEAAVKPRIPGR